MPRLLDSIPSIDSVPANCSAMSPTRERFLPEAVERLGRLLLIGWEDYGREDWEEVEEEACIKAGDKSSVKTL